FQRKAKGEGRGHHGLRRRPVWPPLQRLQSAAPLPLTHFSRAARGPPLQHSACNPYEGLASASACCSAVSTRSSVSASLPASRVFSPAAGSAVTAGSSGATPSSGVARLAAAPEAFGA